MSIKSHSTSSNSTKRFIKATTTGSGLTAFQEAAVSLYANIVQYQFLMVGGGGSVNQPNPGIGGGGAGSFIQGNIILQKNVSTNVVIGAGAASSPGPLGSVADRGNESWLKQNDFAIVALGGGRSGVPAQYEFRGTPFDFTGYPGGSGGGGSISSPNPGSLVGGIGLVGGFPGGLSAGTGGGGGGGGGGGATQAGQNASAPQNKGGKGGDGANVSWVPTNYGVPGWGPGRWFAGGGAGGSQASVPATTTRQQGGSGGGGFGGTSSPAFGTETGASGNVNTGGGGGGRAGTAGSPATVTGGSGVVIFSVPLTATWTNVIGANVETTATANIIGFRTSGQITFT